MGLEEIKTMNFEQARQNMIEQQIRPWDVLDERVLNVLADVHREDFVPGGHRRLAFSDLSLPLGHGEVMMKPVVEGRMLQALEVTGADRVLEVGTGSGHIAACLAALGGRVTSIEIHGDFVAEARKRLRAAGLEAEVGEADVFDWQPAGRFDVICVTGAVPDEPERFGHWLEVGGRMFVIVGESPAMEALLITRTAEDQWVSESLFETDLPYLVGAEKPKPFEL